MRAQADAGPVGGLDGVGIRVALLHQGGTKVSLIAALVQELNASLFERTWQLIAPPDLVLNSCLFVMGSEGRGEQLLKTDQDNGLVIRDGYTPPANLAELCDRFSAALRNFGYPDCPGNIMVSNPNWRQTASDFAHVTRQWLLMPTPDSLMSLAIFLDAHAVCGDASLLEGLRLGVFDVVTDNDAMLARFASAINSFPESGGWWNRLLLRGDSNEESLDLKKAGIFVGKKLYALTRRKFSFLMLLFDLFLAPTQHRLLRFGFKRRCKLTEFVVVLIEFEIHLGNLRF